MAHLPGWSWGWLYPEDHPDFSPAGAKGLLGLCDFSAQTLYFNPEHVESDPWDEVLDTLAHEIAHAYALDEEEDHGPVWRFYAKLLGASVDLC